MRTQYSTNRRNPAVAWALDKLIKLGIPVVDTPIADISGGGWAVCAFYGLQIAKTPSDLVDITGKCLSFAAEMNRAEGPIRGLTVDGVRLSRAY